MTQSEGPYRTVLIGAGKIGARYSTDPVMARHFRYATHAQVLADHPAFAWDAVVDENPQALREAVGHWGIGHACATTRELGLRYAAEVAVVATPPGGRRDVLDALPALRAVVVEKPLGRSRHEAADFVNYCLARGLALQVNLWRRADATLRALAAGELESRIGAAQAVFGVYGNGILNNATHLVDLVCMLLGPVAAVQAMAASEKYREGPLPDDVNLPFTMVGNTGVVCMFAPLRFRHYRENALDIWGERGRATFYQEGLDIAVYPQVAHRAVEGETEVATDRPTVIPSTAGEALYHLYDNLALTLAGRSELWSGGPSALASEALIHMALDSAVRGGVVLTV